MSVITSHRITPVNKELNLKEYLIQNGYVHEQDLYSKKRQETVHLYHVLDYKKCNYEKAMEIRETYKKRYDENNTPYTEEELDQLLYMPVYFTEDNFICWNLNYYSDDAPSVMIGSLLPNEQFIYVEYTEGKLNGSCYFKGPTNSCTKDGQKIEGYITRIIEDLIKEENDKQYKVKLPLFPTDKYFATFYIDKDQVQSLNVLDDINPEQDLSYKKRKKYMYYRYG